MSHKIVIDGVEYTVGLLKFKDSLEIFQALQTVIGPVLACVIENVQEQNENFYVEAVANYLTHKASIDEYELLKKLFHNTYVDFSQREGEAGGGQLHFKENNDPCSVDILFAGKLKNFYQLAAFAISVNYPDFFSGAFSQLKTLMSSFKEMTNQWEGERSELEKPLNQDQTT